MAQPGYPLPEGELGEDEIVCQLVYLPDRPEYWQAFYAALHYMTTWRAWERDEDRRGKDAAANWRVAFELTSESWRMACLEELQSDVHDILLFLQNNPSCCEENVTFNIATSFTTDIFPGAGDDPEFYGETAVADWEEWNEYLCHNSRLWLDELIHTSGNIEAALEFGGMTIALLAGAIVGISFFVVGGVVAMPMIYAALAGLIAGISSTLFEDAADDLAENYDDIICTIMSGSSLSDAIETALGSGAAWDLFYSFIDYESAAAILYEGGDGETYLEAEKSEECDCDEFQIGEFRWEWDFNDGFGIMVNQDNWIHRPVEEDIVKVDSWMNGSIWLKGGQLAEWAGGDEFDSIRIRKIGIDAKATEDASSLWFSINHDGGGSPYEPARTIPHIDYQTIGVNLDEEEENLTTEWNDQIVFRCQFLGNQTTLLDNAYIEFDLIT